MTTVLIVEDNFSIRTYIASLLEAEGFTALGAASAEAAIGLLRKAKRNGAAPPDVLLLDIRLAKLSGLELVEKHGDLLPPTIMISGEATISEAVASLRLGVHDFIEKPFSDERLILSVKNLLEKIGLQSKLAQLETRLGDARAMLGSSAAMERVRDAIRKLAPTDARVLVRGESGTGKELVASRIHELSPRKNGPFIKINCAAFPPTLIEAELFGHARGAFTGAQEAKKGLFERAHGGTLFLDEIGDMAFELQAKLLRVLEDGVIRRIGDTREHRVDVRVVAATNSDLETQIKQGRFREDLYFRLANLPIVLTPLRERGEDIPVLLDHFMRHFAEHHRMPPKTLAPGVLSRLCRHGWPGNVRELKHLCERLVIFASDPVGLGDLPEEFGKNDSDAEPGHDEALIRVSAIYPMPLKQFRSTCEKVFIATLLARNDWNMTRVAELLDISRPHLHQVVKTLGIHREP